jgi:molybdopterin converting factor subunit 1
MSGVAKVLAFAGARELIGAAEVEVEVDSPHFTVAAVLDRMCARYPGLHAYRPIIRVAVNGAYAADTDPVAAGDEVALIPPVAGG